MHATSSRRERGGPAQGRRILQALAWIALVWVCYPTHASGQGEPTDDSSSGAEFFGLAAEGTRFVFVLDRSASMSDPRGRPLQAAKAELRKSLARLQETQQFQIIFYNQAARPLRLNTAAAGMLWASEENKSQAARSVERITADGGTDHQIAFRAGLALRPDVLFFLTDADRPQLTEGAIQEILDRNAGSQIYTIEFGRGPATSGENPLKLLADQTGGKYTYVDVLTWEPAP